MTRDGVRLARHDPPGFPLHSTNDELQTINTELQRRDDELDEVNGFLEAILTNLRSGSSCSVIRRALGGENGPQEAALKAREPARPADRRARPRRAAAQPRDLAGGVPL